MKNILLIGTIAGFGAYTAQAQVDLKVYKTYSEDLGSHINFSDLSSESDVPNVLFGASQGNFNWHPDGLGSFGADFTGAFNVTGGTYHISLYSDDASYMFIDGALQISRPGPHGPDFTAADIPLSAGTHSFEVQFYECCTGASGVDAVLPDNVVIVPPNNELPDVGTTVSLFGIAAGFFLPFARRARK